MHYKSKVYLIPPLIRLRKNSNSLLSRVNLVNSISAVKGEIARLINETMFESL